MPLRPRQAQESRDFEANPAMPTKVPQDTTTHREHARQDSARAEEEEEEEAQRRTRNLPSLALTLNGRAAAQSELSRHSGSASRFEMIVRRMIRARAPLYVGMQHAIEMVSYHNALERVKRAIYESEANEGVEREVLAQCTCEVPLEPSAIHEIMLQGIRLTWASQDASSIGITKPSRGGPSTHPRPHCRPPPRGAKERARGEAPPWGH